PPPCRGPHDCYQRSQKTFASRWQPRFSRPACRRTRGGPALRAQRGCKRGARRGCCQARACLQGDVIMAFDFSPSDEQTMLIETIRQFMAEEIFPHEREVERLGEVPLELGKQIQKRS